MKDIHLLENGVSYRAECTKLFDFTCTDKSFNIIQGGFFDGEKYAVCCTKKDDRGYETTRLALLDARGKTIRESGDLLVDHANNLTYNPKLGVYVVTHCQSPDEHICRYSYIDPETLFVTKTADAAYRFYALAYCPALDKYASAGFGGRNFDVWDGEMNNVLHVTDHEKPGPVPQGVFCDEYATYHAYSGTKQFESAILIMAWDGAITRNIPVSLPERFEAESINIADGSVYIVGNDWENECGSSYVLDFVREDG